LEHLEIENSSQTKWPVFVAVLGEKLLQNNQSLQIFAFGGSKTAALSLILNNFSVLCRKKL